MGTKVKQSCITIASGVRNKTLVARLKPGSHRRCVLVLVGVLSGFGWLAGHFSDMIHPEMALLIYSACIVFI